MFRNALHLPWIHILDWQEGRKSHTPRIHVGKAFHLFSNAWHPNWRILRGYPYIQQNWKNKTFTWSFLLACQLDKNDTKKPTSRQPPVLGCPRLWLFAKQNWSNSSQHHPSEPNSSRFWENFLLKLDKLHIIWPCRWRCLIYWKQCRYWPAGCQLPKVLQIWKCSFSAVVTIHLGDVHGRLHIIVWKNIWNQYIDYTKSSFFYLNQSKSFRRWSHHIWYLAWSVSKLRCCKA